MLKKLFLLTLVACSFSCHKNKQTSACGTQVCTAIFTIINIHFTDKNGNGIAVQNYSVVNQRTHLTLTNGGATNNPLGTGYYVVADDSSKSKLSADGDDLLVSATNPATNQTKTVTIKAGGGQCACHVYKISGVETVAFD